MGELAFGPFRMDLESARLLRGGSALDLRPQGFNALRALIQNYGRHVDYEQMIQQAWGGAVVSRHTVAVTVGEAKKVLGEYGSWIQYRPKLGYSLEIPAAEDLIRKGQHFAQRFTRDGFEKALDCFREAAGASSADFRAFQGMSSCYLMLGSLGLRPPRETYAKFREAQREAVALRGLTPGLRADNACALHLFERQFSEAERELLAVAKESPDFAPVFTHLVMLYLTNKRFEEAERALARAYAADPLWPLPAGIEIFLRICKREFELAAECGEKAVELHPYVPIGRFFYAYALQCSGKLCDAIEQFRLVQVMSPCFPWPRAHEAVCLAESGNCPQAERILDELEQRRRVDYVDPYNLVRPYDVLGRRQAALGELERACDEGSVALAYIDVDPKMDSLRGEPRFERVRDHVLQVARSDSAIGRVSAQAVSQAAS